MPTTLGGLLLSLPAAAQLPLEPDSTLGGESSVVTPVAGLPGFFIIEGGAARGSNLFHSFQEFNVNENGGVFFADPAAIDNVITRVTGNNPSNILGFLGMFNDANLFLLNPNGIFFGENGRLSLQGSFVASTADSLMFPDDLDFSAVNPDPTALLSINVPIGLQFGDQPAPIITNEALLTVPTEQSLILAGGPVTLDGSSLFLSIPDETEPSSGRIEVAAIGEAGAVDLAIDGRNLALRLPATLQRADIRLRNTAFVGTSGNRGGAIALYGDHVSLRDGSTVSFGIGQDLGTVGSQLGDVQVDATGRVLLSGESFIENGVFAGGTGTGGDIRIDATQLIVRDGASIRSISSGRGGTGDILIRVRDRLLVTGTDALGSAPSAITSEILSDGIGSGGSIDIETSVLRIQNGGVVRTSLLATGDAGAISIRASDRLWVLGRSENGDLASAISSSTEQGSVGSGGNLFLTTRVLEVRDGANILSSAAGRGNAGNIVIRSGDRILISDAETDASSNNTFSLISTSTLPGSVGQGGNIDIATRVLELQNGVQISTSTNGIGDAGTLRLQADDRIRFSDSRQDGRLPTSVSTSVGIQGIGNGGRLEIRTPVLEILDGSFVDANTRGRGEAGRIIIQAIDRIRLAGNSQSGEQRSRISSSVSSTAIGNGNNVEITTPILEVFDGGSLSTNVFGRGNAGNVIIRAANRVLFSGTTTDARLGSGATSDVLEEAVGRGGNIEIITGVLEVREGARIGARTSGRGNAGNVIIQARDRVRFIGRSASGNFPSGAFSTAGATANGNGGSIEINTAFLEVRNGAEIDTSTFGRGDAGDVVLRARDRAIFSGVPLDDQPFSVLSSSIQRSGVGQGGDVTITTPFLEVSGGAVVSTSTAGRGSAGNVFINTDRTLVRGSSNIQSGVVEGAQGNGSNVEIRTRILQLRGGGQILTNTEAGGNAGNVVVRAGDRLVISGPQSDRFEALTGVFSVVEEGAVGNGGTIDIRSPLVDIDNGVLSAESQGAGIGGNIFIATDRLQLANQSQINTETFSTDGGNITLTVDDLFLLRENSLVSTEAGTTQSGGDGGDITINNSDGFIVAVPDENSDIVANAFEGRGGNIRITTQGIFGLEFRDERTPLSDITASSEIGVDGDVEIITPNVDPTQGLVELPTDVVDAANQIGQVCPTGPGAAAQLGSFVVTGRGGMSHSPLNVLDDPDITVDWLEDGTPTIEETNEPIPQSQSQPPALVEADGWIRSEEGQVQLVATQAVSESGVEDSLHPCP
ncbi:two-partner secretion domain-containing protein [Vacuolonema iberomarrocanum]|uniref:two-partner secretion domain-containing protein n=1 Tax=Vacuolonema iberomarrocanum TaxID=3454632 RepID=UPI0019EA0D61|nr:filamentous hemagglutinin N-terminal domain-containing protein [filamentous cyanobacterium LEGE 07170]